MHLWKTYHRDFCQATILMWWHVPPVFFLTKSARKIGPEGVLSCVLLVREIDPSSRNCIASWEIGRNERTGMRYSDHRDLDNDALSTMMLVVYLRSPLRLLRYIHTRTTFRARHVSIPCKEKGRWWFQTVEIRYYVPHTPPTRNLGHTVQIDHLRIDHLANLYRNLPLWDAVQGLYTRSTGSFQGTCP